MRDGASYHRIAFGSTMNPLIPKNHIRRSYQRMIPSPARREKDNVSKSVPKTMSRINRTAANVPDVRVENALSHAPADRYVTFNKLSSFVAVPKSGVGSTSTSSDHLPVQVSFMPFVFLNLYKHRRSWQVILSFFAMRLRVQRKHKERG